MALTMRYMVVKPRSLKSERSNNGPPFLIGGTRVRIQGSTEITTTMNMIAMIRRAHSYPRLLIRYRFNGANAAPPIPDPATEIPDANPLLLSNHWTGTASAGRMAIPIRYAWVVVVVVLD